MPAERGIELFPSTLARHERFAAAALFSGTAEENDRAAAAAILKIFLNGKGRCKRGYAQQIVSAAVAVSVMDDRVFFA